MRSSLISLTENEPDFFAIRERLIPFIRVRLCQFNLVGYYQPDDVLNESFLRLWRKKQIGKNIPNIEGWLHLTAHNVIREYARQRSREEFMPNKIYKEIHDLNSNSDAEGLEEYKPLREAFFQLPAQTRELLSLRFVRGLSWNEIVDFYTKRGEKVSAATLRKRHQRALNVLRELVLTKL